MTDIFDLLPYQETGAAWLAPRPQALLADDMGLGKSAQAIRAADMVGARSILVLCPASVRVNWQREFEKFSPMDRPCRVVFSGSDTIDPQGVTICSYDLAVAGADRLRKMQWDLIVADEAHYLKERTAKRTRLVYGHGSTRPGIDKRADLVWRLTGTPAPNDFSELFTHMKSMGAATEPYWDFVFRYCTGMDQGFGFKITGSKNEDELKQRLAPFMLRRKKEDVLPDLPELFYQTVNVDRSKVVLDYDFYEQYCDLKGGQKELLRKIEEDDKLMRAAIAAAKDGEARIQLLESLAPSMVTLRRYIGMAKLPACLDIIEEELQSKRSYKKIVLFAVHRSVIEATRQRLQKYGVITLYGGTPPEKRMNHIDRFTNDPRFRVFVGNVIAAGTGVNLTVANEAAFLEQDWTPANNAQAAMRVHRIGQTKKVRVRIFALDGSVDERVQDVLFRKMNTLSKIF